MRAYFTNTDTIPAYLTGTTETVDTAHNFYWANRVIAALASMLALMRTARILIPLRAENWGSRSSY